MIVDFITKLNRKKIKKSTKIEWRNNDMKKEDIKNTPEWKASEIAYRNGCLTCYDWPEMAFYIFSEGIKFGKTGKMPQEEMDNM